MTLTELYVWSELYHYKSHAYDANLKVLLQLLLRSRKVEGPSLCWSACNSLLSANDTSAAILSLIADMRGHCSLLYELTS